MRFLIAAAVLALGAIPAMGQDMNDLNMQIHGYATQGFVYTTQNNAFTMNSSNGSPAWTEAVVNLSLKPAEKLRVGVQARYFVLGDFGNDITLDWAMADYKADSKFGVRFGKVKTPSGLFNEIQDIDPSYLWVLLPQGIYPLTSRTPELSHLGGVVYGSVNAGGDSGRFDYSVWGGEQVLPKDDGDFTDQTRDGFGPTGDLMTPTFGGALHWKTPLRGLMVGASDSRYQDAKVSLTSGGSQLFPQYNIEDYFTQYNRDKLMLAFEWNRQAQETDMLLPGQPLAPTFADDRVWYGMATYKLTNKLTAGVYHMQAFDHQAELGPDRYSKDWTVAGRYDVNEYLYAKFEEHFIDGSDLNYFEAQNPKGVLPDTKLTALKLGVSF